MGRKLKDPAEKAVKITVTVGADLFRRIKEHCDDSSITLSAYVNRALEESVGVVRVDSRIEKEIAAIKKSADRLTALLK